MVFDCVERKETQEYATCNEQNVSEECLETKQDLLQCCCIVASRPHSVLLYCKINARIFLYQHRLKLNYELVALKHEKRQL